MSTMVMVCNKEVTTEAFARLPKANMMASLVLPFDGV